MASKAIQIARIVSFVASGAIVILFALSLVLDPMEFHVSLTDEFHVGFLRGRIAFFSDAEYGPYQGSIIGLVDADGNVYPPLEREVKWGDTLGVYFRYFRWTDSTLWTLTVSFLWPLAIFGLPSALWIFVWWHRRKQVRRSKDNQRRYKRLRVEEKRDVLVVYFNSPKVHSAAERQEIGRELLSIVDVAASTDMPMALSFRGVESISSALLGTLVTVNWKAKASGVTWRLRDMSPAVAEVFRRIWPGDGPAGVFAVLKPPPKNDGGRAYPEYDEDEDS